MKQRFTKYTCENCKKELEVEEKPFLGNYSMGSITQMGAMTPLGHGHGGMYPIQEEDVNVQIEENTSWIVINSFNKEFLLCSEKCINEFWDTISKRSKEKTVEKFKTGQLKALQK